MLPNSYRLIALETTPSKLLERTVAIKMIDIAEEKYLFP